MDPGSCGSYDKVMIQTAKPRLVVVLLYDDVQLLDFAGPADVFAQANLRAGGRAYELLFVAVGGEVRGTGGLSMVALPVTEIDRPIHTLLIPGGPMKPVAKALHDAQLLAWISHAARGASRVISICSGAFLLGAVGLLDGRRATTHWMGLDEFAKRFPKVLVERDALFVQDGPIWSSAGVASGIDLALGIVAADLTPAIALQVARDLVLHLVRPGGQSQFTGPLSLQTKAGPDLTRLVPWLEQHLHRSITVADMADAMGMSERSFHRRCLRDFAMAPARLLAELRLERARTLLGDQTIAVKNVAALTGFADPAAFSTAFLRRFGATPSSYRHAFAERTSAHLGLTSARTSTG
jgi:transcriptional regulator GlxA family with amidase domain